MLSSERFILLTNKSLPKLHKLSQNYKYPIESGDRVVSYPGDRGVTVALGNVLIRAIS